jgi:cell division protein FtsL
MSLLEKRYRGFRVINFAGLGVLLVLALGVYLAKTAAGREASQIKTIERQIAAERRAIRNLQAEVATLERPDRIERLSTAYLGLAPVDAKREAPVDALPALAASKGGVQP